MLFVKSLQITNVICKKFTNNKRMWRKGNPCTLLIRMGTGTGTVENNMDISQKTQNRTTIGFSNFWVYTQKKKMRTSIQKAICTPMFKAAPFKIAKIQKQLVSINTLKKM